MKTHLTYQDEKSHKFWQIETAENSFTVTYGKVGTSGQSKSKTFADSQTAEKEAEKLIEQKEKNGYKKQLMTTTKIDLEKKRKAIDKVFEDHTIIGATIASKNHILFVTREIQWMTEEDLDNDDVYEKGNDELMTWLITYNSEVLGYKGGFSGAAFKGIQRITPINLLEKKTHKTLGLCAEGNYKGLVDEYFDIHDMGPEKRIKTPITTKHYTMWTGATIGESIYFAGTPRTLYKRLSPGEWINLTDRKMHPHMFVDVEIAEAKSDEEGFVDIRLGFEAVDGFAEDDIYAGGEQGDLWHYNGKDWERINTPIKGDITSICCAPDGFVYIVCYEGSSLCKGRIGKQWQEIKVEGNLYNYQVRLSWFQNQLWAASKYDLCRLEKENNELVVKKYSFPKGSAQLRGGKIGGLCSCDEALMVWTGSQVLLFDGKNWEEFLNSN